MKDTEMMEWNGPANSLGNSTVLCFAAGFAAGIAAGAAATLLLAPQSGERTRKQLGQKAHEGEEWLKQKAEKVENRIRDQHEDLVHRAHAVADAISRP